MSRPSGGHPAAARARRRRAPSIGRTSLGLPRRKADPKSARFPPAPPPARMPTDPELSQASPASTSAFDRLRHSPFGASHICWRATVQNMSSLDASRSAGANPARVVLHPPIELPVVAELIWPDPLPHLSHLFLEELPRADPPTTWAASPVPKSRSREATFGTYSDRTGKAERRTHA